VILILGVPHLGQGLLSTGMHDFHYADFGYSGERAGEVGIIVAGSWKLGSPLLAKLLVTALRSLLGFLRVTGVTAHSLVSAVRSMPLS
jgi:hypothetical protein